MIIVREETVVGRQIDLREKSTAAHIVARSTLTDCDLVLPGARRAFLLVNSTFEECRFKAKSLPNCQQWLTNQFRSCSFHGAFKSNDFGKNKLSELPGLGEQPRGMWGCDFRNARLHQSRFFNMDAELAGHRFASFPTILVLRPVEHEARVRELLSGRLERARPHFLAYGSEVTALALDLAVVGDKEGLGVEDLMNALSLEPGIVTSAGSDGRLQLTANPGDHPSKPVLG